MPAWLQSVGRWLARQMELIPELEGPADPGPAYALPHACATRLDRRGDAFVLRHVPTPPAAGPDLVEVLTADELEALGWRYVGLARRARAGTDGASLAGALPGKGVTP